MQYDAQVIVVGGGPAGSSTAWHLAKAGVDVLLLDRATFPRDKACSEYLSPEASRILSNMEVLEQIENSGAAQLTGMTVRAPNGAQMQGDFVGNHGFKGFRDRGLALRRTILDSILLNSARNAGVNVLEKTRVTDVSKGCVTAMLSDGSSKNFQAQIVVGADGLRSIVARRLGLLSKSIWPQRIALVTHYRGIEKMQSCGEMHVFNGGYIGIADVGNGEANVALVVSIPRRVLTGLLRAPSGQTLVASQQNHLEPSSKDIVNKTKFFEDNILSIPHLAERFQNAERTTDVSATGPFAVKARRAWAPRTALVGDAADFFDPFTGEGIFTALRGGELLAPYVKEALNGSDAPLKEYDRERRKVFGGKWKVERLVGAAVASPVVMNHVGRVLSKRKDMADILVGVVGDFIPASEVLRPSYLYRLMFS